MYFGFRGLDQGSSGFKWFPATSESFLYFEVPGGIQRELKVQIEIAQHKNAQVNALTGTVCEASKNKARRHREHGVVLHTFPL